jgi:mannose-6-phosphate isomerase-like protein (cupin superfamily)
MAEGLRPDQVGQYELLEDFDTRAASVRVIRMHGGVEEVEPHVHMKSTQIYVAVEGSTTILRDGVETVIAPFQALSVSPGTIHAARPVGELATVVNISIPPLAADDQRPTPAEGRGFDLPMEGSDVDD